MRIFANGMEMDVAEDTTVIRLLELLEEPPVADLLVEINRRFVHAKEYGSRLLKEGDIAEANHLSTGG